MLEMSQTIAHAHYSDSSVHGHKWHYYGDDDGLLHLKCEPPVVLCNRSVHDYWNGCPSNGCRKLDGAVTMVIQRARWRKHRWFWTVVDVAVDVVGDVGVGGVVAEGGDGGCGGGGGGLPLRHCHHRCAECLVPQYSPEKNNNRRISKLSVTLGHVGGSLLLIGLGLHMNMS